MQIEKDRYVILSFNINICIASHFYYFKRKITPLECRCKNFKVLQAYWEDYAYYDHFFNILLHIKKFLV